MSEHIPERRGGLQWKMILTLTLVWLVLWGEVSIFLLVAGLLLGLLITVVFPLPPLEFHGRFHLLGSIRLVLRLVLDLFRASAVVAAQAFRIGYIPHNAVVKVQLRTIDDLYLTATAEMVTLVPGSIVLEARRQDGVLYLHVMDVHGPDDLAAAKQDVLDAEARVIQAFGSRAEIEALRDGRPMPPPPRTDDRTGERSDERGGGE